MGKLVCYDSKAVAQTISLAGFGVLALMGCIVLLCRRDVTPAIPNLLLVVFSNSANGLGKAFVPFLCVIIPIVLACMGLHAWLWYFKYPPTQKFHFTFGKLKWSMLVLLISATISGLGCGFFSLKYIPMMIAMTIAYFAIYVLVLNCAKCNRDYLMKCFFAIGLVVCVELVFYYLVDGGDFWEKIINRQYRWMGWTKCVNAVCSVLFFCIPPALYLTAKSKYSPLFLSGALVMLINGIFTLSRGNLLVGVIILLPLTIYTLIRAEYRTRTLITAFLWVSVATAVFVACYSTWKDVFSRFLVVGDGSGRIPIWKNSLQWFKKYPVLGMGYYGPNNHPDILASHYSRSVYKVHNTVLQVMMCSGIVGLIATAYHYLQKAKLWKGFGLFKLYMLCSILFIEGEGLMDLTITTAYIMMFMYVFLAAVEKEKNPEPLTLKRHDRFHF